ncbi:hypothetical protein C8R46DRAFT_648799 [Mycena filopes]|nr:hypothetical protein C8R46DRAFT_648799 [Mycena filopes]
MAVLPQELVDAIIHEIDDVPTLKACCLEGSMFRRTSQCMLWRALGLNIRNSGAFPSLSALLDESPHVAGYIHELDIDFTVLRPEHVQNFIEILSKLRHLHSFRIFFYLSWGHRSIESHPRFISTFLDLLARQPDLRELHVASTCLTSDVFLRLLTLAPVSSWYDVQITVDDTPQQPHLHKLRDLTLGPHTKGIDELLVQPELREYTQHLLRLTLNRDPRCELIFTAASTLEHINFYILGPRLQTTVAIPLLPALRSVEFWFSFGLLAQYSGLILTILDSVLSSLA